MNELKRAIRYYKKARKIDQKEAQKKRRPTQSRIGYNLACALAKNGDLDEVVETLAPNVHEFWEDVNKDTDFENLWSSPEHMERLRKFIAEE